MFSVTPTSGEDLAIALRFAAQRRQTISITGSGTKHLMGGPIMPAELTLCTSALNRILDYEPNDLTISVEAGHNFASLQQTLAKQGQMIALDPPFWNNATIGGVVASNSHGPMRRAYGTARDLVIGMKFSTLAGKTVSVGGMVVKNVAGLDIGKLLVGSFGTLAVITSLNFRLHALPEETNTYLYSFSDLDSALEKRDAIMKGPLQPMAFDLISPSAAVLLGTSGYVLGIRAGGSNMVLRRYERELRHSDRLSGTDEAAWWTRLREFPADFLAANSAGVVLRLGTTLTKMKTLLTAIPDAFFIARATAGITYVYLNSWHDVQPLWQAAENNGWSAAIEYAANDHRTTQDLWLLRSAGKSDSSFAMMKKIKQMFDPNNLLNRSRLYGRL